MAASCLFIVQQADANGINPPRPSGSELVTARCTLRTPGAPRTLERARVDAADSTDGLQLRLGPEKAQAIPLTKIARIRVPSRTLRADGFAKALIDVREPSYQGAGWIRLKDSTGSIVLTGFAASSPGRVEIPLASCKELSFEVRTDSDLSRHETTKK
jgi:hypothetical protein